ncbi:MAG: DUF177 domain-containing protein [Desulfobulbaceae bacterium]|nr:DUF177 domain-containing protein [Desulfobulbaceae bacterium]
MKIDFFEIPDEGISITLKDTSWLPRELQYKGQTLASLSLKKVGEQRVIVVGRLTTTVGANCDRCLEEFDLPLDAEFKVDLEFVDRSEADFCESDHFCHDNEMDVVNLHDSQIDIVDLLQQQLYLLMPIKKLCRKQCKGICSSCGANLNESRCECVQETASPFSQLAKLKID